MKKKKKKELQQLEAFSDLVSILDKVKDMQNKNIVLECDFNVIFDINVKV